MDQRAGWLAGAVRILQEEICRGAHGEGTPFCSDPGAALERARGRLGMGGCSRRRRRAWILGGDGEARPPKFAKYTVEHVEQIADVPGPQVHEEIVEVIQLAPQEHEDTAGMTADRSVGASCGKLLDRGRNGSRARASVSSLLMMEVRTLSSFANNWSALRSHNRETRCLTIRNTTTARGKCKAINCTVTSSSGSLRMSARFSPNGPGEFRIECGTGSSLQPTRRKPRIFEVVEVCLLGTARPCPEIFEGGPHKFRSSQEWWTRQPRK